jgi:hypothetical protein
VGECRICLLYMPVPASTPAPAATSSGPSVTITGLVAGRILALSNNAEQAPQIVFQPGVIITRAAETATEIAAQAAARNSTGDIQTTSPPPPPATAVPNPYIYKMTLAH